MNKNLLVGISALLLVSFSFSLSIFAEEITSSESVEHSTGHGNSGPCINPIQQPSPVGNNNSESRGTDLNDVQSEIHLFKVSIFLI